jgi:RNA polymerase sigma factor (TIGR02999 family)
MEDFTHLLRAVRSGDQGALGKVFSIMYRELCLLARRQLRKINRDGTLDTTALVHECYLRLAGAESLALHDRAHFLGYAARVMRSICVDCAREAGAQRRYAGQPCASAPADVADPEALSTEESLQLIAALQQLACMDERLASVVTMKYFSGFTDAEIAEKSGVSERTVRRDWQRARLLLSTPFESRPPRAAGQARNRAPAVVPQRVPPRLPGEG